MSGARTHTSAFLISNHPEPPSHPDPEPLPETRPSQAEPGARILGFEGGSHFWPQPFEGSRLKNAGFLGDLIWTWCGDAFVEVQGSEYFIPKPADWTFR